MTIPAMEEIIGLVNQPLTMRATFVDGGWFAGQVAQDEAFEVKLAQVDGEASEIVTTVDGTPSHESALDVSKGSEVIVEAEFHFEDGSHYTTSSSEFVTWAVTPEDAGVTVDENGVVDTSGVTVTGEESVNVTITAIGHGPFEGVTKTVTMTVTPPAYPEGSLEVPGVGVFTKPLTAAQADALGVTYSHTYSEVGGTEAWPQYTLLQAEAMCEKLGDYHLASKDELLALYNAYPNNTLLTNMGWPTYYSYWSMTPFLYSEHYQIVAMAHGGTGSNNPSMAYNASCVSGSTEGYTEGSIEVPNVGTFTKPLTTAQAEEYGVAYSNGYVEDGVEWAQFTQPQAVAMCEKFGYRLASRGELVDLYAANPDNQIHTVSGWPTGSIYLSSTPFPGPDYDYYYVTLRNGNANGYKSHATGFHACLVL